MRPHVLAFVLAFAAVFAAPASAAPIPALDFTSSTPNPASFNSTRGYAFDVTTPGLVLTHLSFFDQGANGLAESHAVGLWDPAGILLASITVPAGVAAPLDATGKFRFVDVPDVPLPIGTGYSVGGFFVAGSGDAQASILAGITTAPGITYGGTRFNAGPALAHPTSTNPITGFPGGSFLVDTAADVPEPGTVAVFGLLAVGGLVARRRKAIA